MEFSFETEKIKQKKARLSQGENHTFVLNAIIESCAKNVKPTPNAKAATCQRPQSKQAHSVFQSAPPIQPLQAASVRLAMTSADSHPTGWSEQTVLVIYSPKLYTLRYLADLFGIKSSYQIIMKTDSSATVDIEIRIGENWVGRLPPG